METPKYEYKTQGTPFPGFPPKRKGQFFMYPMMLESYWYMLSGSEQKVLDFILRQTLGFQKATDAIALSQFVKGIGKSNKGTGLSLSQVRRAIAGLESKGFVVTEKTKFKSTVFHLKLEGSGTETSNTVEKVTASHDTTRLIKLCESIAPHSVNDYISSKQQIKAIEKLVECYGVNEVEKFVLILPQTNGLPYAPVITSPVDLEKKLPKLIAFVQKKQQEQKSGFRIIV